MATIRVQKNNNYVVLNNTALNDQNLSFKAKGIFAYLMSKPDNWTCQVKDLQKHSKDGRDSIYNGLKELREHGYMIKRPVKNDKNVIIAWEEILFEIPQDEAKEVYKKQVNKKAISGKSVSGKKSKKSTSGFSVSGKSVSGKPVNIYNTNILNTDILSIDTSSSSNSIKQTDLFNKFEDNICMLRKTTAIKFSNYINTYNQEFINAVIDYCCETGIVSFAGFKTVIDTYIKKDILTKDEFNLSVETYRNTKKSKKNKFINNKKTYNFNNYTQREYTQEQFKELENNLTVDMGYMGPDALKEKLKNRNPIK